MKTLLSIVMVAIFGTMVSANPGNKTDYIVTKDGKVVVAKVKLGLLNIRAKSGEGQKNKINYNDIITFQKDGVNYVKKPLYNEKGKADCMVFMRLISWRNGLSLYCYEELSAGTKGCKRYFMFKDENTFWLEVDPKNSKTITNFFNRQ
jgi:hypothetical protein